MSGIIHTYYTVALVPAIGALTGIGAVTLWRARANWPARLAAAAGLAVTAGWAFVLLDRTPSWLPGLRWLVLAAGLAAAAAALAWPHLAAFAAARARTRRARLALAGVPLALGLFAGLAGPAAYAIDTASTAHTGSLPTAGPQVTAFGGPGGGTGGGPGGGAGPGTAGRFPGAARGGTTGNTGSAGAPGGFGRPPGSGSTGGAAPGGTTGTARGGAGGRTSAGAAGGTAGHTPGGAGGAGGGLSGDTRVSSALVGLLERGASGYTWVAATEGSQEAAPLELATGGNPVMAIGGFNGTDPAPTLAEFKTLVAEHKIHYYIGRNGESFGGGTGSSAIASWVAAHFTARTVGGQTVYDLTQPRTG